MSADRILALASRVVRQLRRDRRTLGLIFMVPLVVMSLIAVSLPEVPGPVDVLDFLAPALLAAFVLLFVFVLTGVSFLRERSLGTLERLMASPVSRWDIILGYLAGFFLLASLQSLAVLLFTIFVLQVNYEGALWQVFVFQMVITVAAVNLGIFFSVFARNELQVVQFIPLVIVPQLLLSGVMWPVEQMPGYLQAVSKVLPLTYAVRGLRAIMLEGRGLGSLGLELGVLVGFAGLMVLLAASSLRRG
ncbi:MAG: ABC transporter permease [Chloroflexi bacterium]|nr:ABC transporter permease [Chloroflexota bacterium]